MTLNKKLLHLREQHSLTQFEVAEKINVSRQAISKWESGSSIPSMDNLLALSKLYGVTIDYLIDEASSESNLPGAKVAMACSKITLKHLVLAMISLVAISATLLIIGNITNTTASMSILFLFMVEGLFFFVIIRLVAKVVIHNRRTSSPGIESEKKGEE